MARCEMCGEWPDCPWKTDPEIMCGEYHPKPMSNADRIRGMTDEELAIFLDNHGRLWGADIVSTADDWLDWLKQEAEE